MNQIARIGMALTAVLLAAAPARGLVVTGAVASEDGAETFHNPGCGPAESNGSFWVPLKPGMPTDGLELCADAPKNCSAIWDIGAYSKGYLHVTNGVPLYDHYAYVTNHVGGADIPLDENALLSVSNSLLNCRLNGGTCIPRFAYTGEEKYGCEPDDIEIMLTHVRQLAAVISQFRDVVPAVECGMIGPWGEMHNSRYKEAEPTDRVVQAWLEGLPQDMALLVRYPRVWSVRLDTTADALFNHGGLETIDSALRPRMGFFNDGYLGSDSDYGTWRSGDNWWVRDQGRAFLRDVAIPYGGELATLHPGEFEEWVHLFDTNKHNIVEEWYDTHLSYLRNIRYDRYIINQRMKAMTFRSATWAFNGMPDLHEYEGIDLHKFCLDHMGYRYVVRGESINWRRNGATIDLTIENTGFGQLLFWEAHEVLLVPKSGGAPITIQVSLSHPLASIRGGSNAVVSVSFDYPAGIASGEYGLYLRVRAPLPDEIVGGTPRRAIRFANAGCWDENLKANHLCDITLDAWADILPDNVWFAYGAASDTTVGGEWTRRETGAFGLWTRRDFAIDEPLRGGESGAVEIALEVWGFDELPDGGGGDGPAAADFVFLLDGAGDGPVPFCHTADGWIQLQGRAFEEGETVVLKITLDSGFVSYEAGGVVLTDAGGRRYFPAERRTIGVATLSILGGGLVGGFRGRRTGDLKVPTVFSGN